MIESAVFWDYAWRIGGPFVLVCVGLLALYTRRVYTAGAYEEMKTTLKDFYTEQIETERKRHAEEIKEERARSRQYFSIIQDTVIVSRGVVAKLRDIEKQQSDG